MCGIVGYIGGRDAQQILLRGLSRLEYRGYDSAGVAILDGGTISVRKKEGPLAGLAALLCAVPGMLLTAAAFLVRGRAQRV